MRGKIGNYLLQVLWNELIFFKKLYNSFSFNLFSQVQALTSASKMLAINNRVVRVVKNYPEILPLFVIVVGAVAGGTFAIAHKMKTDNQLRKFPPHK